MISRSAKTNVTFAKPFLIEGFVQELPAGDYVVETDEELIQGISFPAYRRVSTTLYVEALPGHPGQLQAWSIDPAMLDAALIRDSGPC